MPISGYNSAYSAYGYVPNTSGKFKYDPNYATSHPTFNWSSGSSYNYRLYTPTTTTTRTKRKKKSGNGGGFLSRLKATGERAWNYIKGLGKSIIKTAAKYLGFNEANGSYKKFTNGRTEAWCADFVTYVTKEAFRAAGKSIPAGFGSPSVSGLRDWGIRTGRYMQTAGKSNKAGLIAKNVKPGDIIIFKNQGASHTGIVEKVDSNGTIHTIEGNTSNKVARRTYAANNGRISGFIHMA